MGSVILKLRLFLGSYAILFGILALRFTTRPLVWGCAALALIGAVDNWRITRLVKRKEPDPYKLEEVHDRGAEVAGYVASYLLPFLTVPEPSGRELLAYLLFLGVVALIYVRSEMVQINPVLYVLGKRLVSVITSDGWTAFLITRDVPHAGEAIEAVSLRSTVLVRVDKGSDNG